MSRQREDQLIDPVLPSGFLLRRGFQVRFSEGPMPERANINRRDLRHASITIRIPR